MYDLRPERWVALAALLGCNNTPCRLFLQRDDGGAHAFLHEGAGQGLGLPALGECRPGIVVEQLTCHLEMRTQRSEIPRSREVG